jgi:signal recognition particle subunit SRP54
MLEDLVQKFDGVLRKLRGTGRITEKNIEETLRDLRRALLEADVHFKVARDFVASVQAKALGREVVSSVTPGQQLVKIFHDELVELLGRTHEPLRLDGAPPAVVLVVGLQGSGKTTFSAKLGAHLACRNRRALLAAADVARPAAVEQLDILGARAGLPVFTARGEKPVRIARLAVDEARRRGRDTVIVDTAGRLHVDDALMAELAEMREAVRAGEILLVADAMTGQDAVRSAGAFRERLAVTGAVLTKMDGDARGGAALSIRAATGLAIRFIGTGEKLDAIEPFHPDRFASRLLGMGDIVTLVEKAQETLDRGAAERLTDRLRRSEFTLEDFLEQLRQVRRMGPLSQVLERMPGLGGRISAGAAPDERAMVRVEAIIQSMTVEERRRPQILNGSRRRRIAAGSGTQVQEVNRLLRDFQSMQQVVRRMGRSKGRNRIPGLPF